MLLLRNFETNSPFASAEILEDMAGLPSESDNLRVESCKTKCPRDANRRARFENAILISLSYAAKIFASWTKKNSAWKVTTEKDQRSITSANYGQRFKDRRIIRAIVWQTRGMLATVRNKLPSACTTCNVVDSFAFLGSLLLTPKSFWRAFNVRVQLSVSWNL